MRKIITVSLMSALMLSTAILSYGLGYDKGFNLGYRGALIDITNLVNSTPIKTQISEGGAAEITLGLSHLVESILFKNHTDQIDQTLLNAGWTVMNKSKGGVYYYAMTHNIMLNKGVERLNKIFYGNSSTSQYGANANATIIGFSSAQYTPSYTDATCQNLITTNGLDPQRGAVVNGTAASGDMQTNITRTFTATGAVTAYVSCLMYGTAAGTVVAAADITDAILLATDTLTQRWIANTTN